MPQTVRYRLITAMVVKGITMIVYNETRKRFRMHVEKNCSLLSLYILMQWILSVGGTWWCYHIK